MELWKTDGTKDGTVLANDINSGSASSFPYALSVIGNTLYFVVFTNDNGEELWKSDGTKEGTILVRDIHPGSMGSEPEYLTVIGNTLYFTADDMINGRELWRSDGTPGGTSLVKDIRLGVGPLLPGLPHGCGQHALLQRERWGHRR
jgi:ELWxxDGT repeat protein